MAKVTIVSPDRASPADRAPGFEGTVATDVYFDGKRGPLQLHRLSIEPDEPINMLAMATDRVGYVLAGIVVIAAQPLPAGSSFIVERGAVARIHASGGPATTLIFTGPSAADVTGGRIHLLPAEAVPRSADLGGTTGVGGAIHADSTCPTSTVWLHENMFAGTMETAPPGRTAGIHAHSEDEIIFVTAGSIRLGARLFARGTALMIEANTFYGFTPGPDGLGFINYRPNRPGDIRFADGRIVDETAYWRERLPRPSYIEA